MQDRLDLSIGIALGSSVQIALLVLPAAVIGAWIMDQPLQLNFNIFEIVCLIMSVLCVTTCLQRGSTNWLIGPIMMTLYIQVAFAFFYNNDFDLDGIVVRVEIRDQLFWCPLRIEHNDDAEQDEEDKCPTQGGDSSVPISYEKGLEGCPSTYTARCKLEMLSYDLIDCLLTWF